MSTVRRAISGDRRCSVMIERSGVAITPPLKPVTGVVIPKGLEQHAQAARRPAADNRKNNSACAQCSPRPPGRAMSDSCHRSTNVPSTSEITAEHLNGNARARLMTMVHRRRRRCSASVGHLAPKVHPLRSVLSFPLDRSADLPRHPWPRRRAPAARRAKRAPPCRRA